MADDLFKGPEPLKMLRTIAKLYPEMTGAITVVFLPGEEPAVFAGGLTAQESYDGLREAAEWLINQTSDSGSDLLRDKGLVLER